MLKVKQIPEKEVMPECENTSLRVAACPQKLFSTLSFLILLLLLIL